MAAAVRAPAEHFVQVLDRLARHALGLARVHLEGARAVLHVLDHVREHDRPHRPERERHVEVQAAAGRLALIEAFLPEQEHTEGFQAHVLQRELVALVVLPEAAGTAGTCGDVDVLMRHLLHAERLRLLLEVVGEVAGGEAGRAALADVGHLTPGKEIRARGGRQDLRAVAEVLHRALDQPLDAPVQAAEQDGGVLPLLAREGARLVGAVVPAAGGACEPQVGRSARQRARARRAVRARRFRDDGDFPEGPGTAVRLLDGTHCLRTSLDGHHDPIRATNVGVDVMVT